MSDKSAMTQAYDYVDSMAKRADGFHGAAPWWHGWALRQAFLDGMARAKVAEPSEMVAALEKERDALRKAAPLCEQHKPDGGARAYCVVCVMMRMSAALSRIDYLCGTPNEMNVSDYDMHCDPHTVVEKAERLAGAIADLRAEVEYLKSFR